jgi:hypothetical protein
MEGLSLKATNKHFLCLVPLFILGNAVIVAPTHNADEFSFLAFLVSFVLCLTVVFFCFLLPFNRATALPLIVLSLYCGFDALITFIEFISNDLLPKMPRFLIILPILTLLGYIAFQRVSVVYKLSLISFWVVAGVILLFFLATAKDFNPKNIFIYQLPNFNIVRQQTLPFIKSIVLPSVLIAFFAKSEGFKKGITLVGVSVGCIAFGICILNSVLLFGIDFAGELAYPYSSAGSTVTFGYLFTRMDGLLYFVYLISCIIKCTVSIDIIKKSRSLLTP